MVHLPEETCTEQSNEASGYSQTLQSHNNYYYLNYFRLWINERAQIVLYGNLHSNNIIMNFLISEIRTHLYVEHFSASQMWPD